MKDWGYANSLKRFHPYEIRASLRAWQGFCFMDKIGMGLRVIFRDSFSMGLWLNLTSSIQRKPELKPFD
jgi:hypothetical protein